MLGLRRALLLEGRRRRLDDALGLVVKTRELRINQDELTKWSLRLSAELGAQLVGPRPQPTGTKLSLPLFMQGERQHRLRLFPGSSGRCLAPLPLLEHRRRPQELRARLLVEAEASFCLLEARPIRRQAPVRRELEDASATFVRPAAGNKRPIGILAGLLAS